MAWHNYKNIGSVQGKLMVVWQPGEMIEFFRELGVPMTDKTNLPRPAGPPDLHRIIAITKKHHVAPDFVEHSAAPGIPTGIPGLKATAQMIRAGFPDFDLSVDDVVAEGDRVVLRLTEKGTQTGTVFGIPPSGRRAQWSAIHVIRVKDGKMVEHWDVIDLMSMLRQIGAIPTPRHAPAGGG